MGGSAFKRIFFWKKKRSPLNKAWRKMRRALPSKKRKKKSILSLDKLNLDNQRKKNSQKTQTQTTGKKQPKSLKRLSLGNMRKESTETASPEKKKDGGALGKIRERIKRKISRESKKGLSNKQENVPHTVNLEETKEQNEPNSPKNEEKVPKKKLKKIMKSIRPTGSKANGELEEKEP